MDPKLVAAAVAAHANAIEGAGDDPGLVALEARMRALPSCVRRSIVLRVTQHAEE